MKKQDDSPGPTATLKAPTVNVMKKLVYLIFDFFCFSGGSVAVTVTLVSPRYALSMVIWPPW